MTPFLLTFQCKDTTGIVAEITAALGESNAWITESHQFSDVATSTFLTRTAFKAQVDSVSLLRASLQTRLAHFDGELMVRQLADRPRVLVMVSKFDHCLVDLLYRQRIGELSGDIVAVVSNHQEARAAVEQSGIRFVHIPNSRETRSAAEAELSNVIEECKADLVVLARYMQILSDQLCVRLRGRAINIHHSFLPGFKGAKPYHQAWERGVKQIGATAHYVTPDLDEGPIIAQDVRAVSHTEPVESLIAAGRDIERVVLFGAVQAHLEARVFEVGGRTVVFR